MLNTLIAIGSEIAQQQSEWDNLVEIPQKITEIDNNGNLIQNHVLIVTFDIDNQSIVFDNGLQAFGKESSPIKYRNIKSEKWGRNGDPWAVTCSFPDKIEILQKSIFGKRGEDSGCGLFQNAISKKQPEIRETTLYKALISCYSLRTLELEDNKKGFDVLTSEYILQRMKGKLSRSQKIALVSIAILSSELGIGQPKLLCELDGYDKFILKQCYNSKSRLNNEEKLCYATGRLMPNVILPEFSDREDLNNIFVSTTINYASNFNKSTLTKNYQIGKETKNALETGSNYIRNQFKNKPLYIAGIRHFVIPTFLNYEGIDIKFELDQIQKMSEWLFSLNELTNLIEGIRDEDDGNIFWINYIAYDSDGNSVKVINHIKDVSSVWFHTIVRKDMEQSNLISNYFNQKRSNLSAIYYAIPIRKDHEKKNDALKLLSQIMEQRKVSIQKLFGHFAELILCHYYNRYRSYSNITPQSEHFDYAISDSVIKYQFLINLLKSLNLIDMEENRNTALEGNESPDKLEQFFIDMGYLPQQQALYWLGRIVWNVGRAQKEKEHSQMPVLNKINYNGMDHSKVQRLFIDCFKLATQYRIVDRIDYSSKQFSRNFPAKEEFWKVSQQEATFYILSGFSLYINNNEKQ